MITRFKIFEEYNDNSLNEKIVKNFNEFSDEIIDIIKSHSDDTKKQIKKILNKILFIISAVDIKEILNDKKEIIYYYIDRGDKKLPTFVYNLEKEKFDIKSFNDIS